MRKDKRRRLFNSLLNLAIDNEEFNSLGLDIVECSDEYELIYVRFQALLDFYEPDMKSEAPYFYNLILLDCSNYLKSKIDAGILADTLKKFEPTLEESERFVRVLAKKNLMCRIFGHKFDRSIIIYNQLKMPSQLNMKVICKRCKIKLNRFKVKID